MLSERQLEALLKVFLARTQAVTEQYLQLMGEHLKDIGSLSATDVHRLIQLKRMNANIEAVKREIARIAGVMIEDVEEIFRQVAADDERFAREVFESNHTPTVKFKPGSGSLSTPVERILKAQLRITAQEMANLSRTTIDSTLYREAVDVAVQTVQTGLTDYTSAIRSAMKRAAADGLKVVYPSGYSRRLDTAVRQNVLDGIRSINQDVLDQLGKEFGADGVEISAHELCATDHLPYQGRQYSRRDFDRIQNTLKRPFGMWNCKHTMYPIVMGVTEPAHTEAELARFAQNSNAEITIDDAAMSRYEWSQQMRRLETRIRAQKDIAVAAKASGDMPARREAQRNINALQEQYARISEAAGLAERPDRMTVAGFRKVKTAEELKKSPEYGIINTSNGQSFMRIYDAQGKEKYRYLQTDAIQKLNNSAAIKRYFEYTDTHGDSYSPITDDFGKFQLDTQKEIAEGLEWARVTYKLEKMPLKITRGATEKGAIALYNTLDRSIRFRPSTKINESFATAVHEMTHFVNHVYKVDVDGIYHEALKNIGIKKGTKKAYNIQREVVGLMNSSEDWETPEELIAYSLERHATGRHNALSTEISRIWLERIDNR